MSTEADLDRLRWAQIFALRTLHEATLEQLLGARNYAVRQLLRERNDVLRDREALGGPKVEFSENDFITPRDPHALLPYIISPSGLICTIRHPLPNNPNIGRFPGTPLLRDMVDISTQTEDADTTLTDIEPPTVEKGSEISNRKRKRSN